MCLLNHFIVHNAIFVFNRLSSRASPGEQVEYQEITVQEGSGMTMNTLRIDYRNSTSVVPWKIQNKIADFNSNETTVIAPDAYDRRSYPAGVPPFRPRLATHCEYVGLGP